MKGIAENVPLYTVVAIALGCFNIHVRFLFHGINVLPYLEPSEVIFAFASLSFEIVYLIFCMGIAILLLSVFKKQFFYEDNKKPAELSVKAKIRALLMMILSIVAGVLVTSYITLSQDLLVLLLFSAVVIVPTIIYLQLRKNVKALYENRGALTYAFMLTVAILYIVLNNYSKARIFYEERTHDLYVFSMSDNKEIRTTDKFKLINSTSRYFFLKNIETADVAIVPVAEVKEVRRSFKIWPPRQ